MNNDSSVSLNALALLDLSSTDLVYRMLAAYQQVSSEKLRPDSLLTDDLGMDSLELLDVNVLLEDFCGIVLSADSYATVQTVGDLIKVVEDARKLSPSSSEKCVPGGEESDDWLGRMRRLRCD